MLESLCNEGNFMEIRLQRRRFPMNIAKLLRPPILKNICERLLFKTDVFRRYRKGTSARNGLASSF